MGVFEIKLEVLADTLDKKRELLQQILTITENQEAILTAQKDADGEDLDALKSMFMQMHEERQKVIDELLSSDKFFENVFNEISADFERHAEDYKPLIGRMQSAIREVTDLDVKIRLQEQRNGRIITSMAERQPVQHTEAARNYIIKQYEKNKEREE